MSDFLNSLIARGFGQAAVLRPRLASRFETLPVSDESEFGMTEVESEQTPEPSAPPEGSHEDIRRSPATLLSFSALPSPGLQNHPIEPPASPALISDDMTHKPESPGEPPRELLLPSTSKIPSPFPSIAPARPADEPGPPQNAGEVKSKSSVPFGRDRSDLSAIRPVVSNQEPAFYPLEGTVSNVEGSPPTLGNLSHREETVPPTRTIRSEEAFVRPTASGQPSENKPAPVPTLRVTIGRIDIQAPPKPSARPAPAPFSPAVPLEEYLKRREGSRR